MALTLYWLDGKDGCRFSPFGWRSRLALAHKGLEPELVPIKFTEKARIAFSGQKWVPVLVDGETTVSDSWNIAVHLDAAYPDRPSLLGGEVGRAEARFINLWADRIVVRGMANLIIHDVFECVQPVDRDYFRESREARFGKPLEEVQAGRETRVDAYRTSLAPLRDTLAEQPFLAGASPAYADHIVMGSFMWARATSPFPLLEADDPIFAWRERMLDLFDGLARNAVGLGA
jgi:glutathione S-transferase